MLGCDARALTWRIVLEPRPHLQRKGMNRKMAENRQSSLFGGKSGHILPDVVHILALRPLTRNYYETVSLRSILCKSWWILRSQNLRERKLLQRNAREFRNHCKHISYFTKKFRKLSFLSEKVRCSFPPPYV